MPSFRAAVPDRGQSDLFSFFSKCFLAFEQGGCRGSGRFRRNLLFLWGFFRFDDPLIGFQRRFADRLWWRAHIHWQACLRFCAFRCAIFGFQQGLHVKAGSKCARELHERLADNSEKPDVDALLQVGVGVVFHGAVF